MGTNFYLQSHVPIHAYPQIHLTKRSWGWKPLFEEHEEGEEIERYGDYFTNGIRIPEIKSINDIKAAVESGAWKIVDEYGEQYTWDEFYRGAVQWNGGNIDNSDFIVRDHQDLSSNEFPIRKDDDGYEWTPRTFS